MCCAQCGTTRADVGLCVKHAGRGLCVPDYVRPAAGDTGWTYSQALAAVVEQYKVCASPSAHCASQRFSRAVVMGRGGGSLSHGNGVKPWS